MNTSYLVVKNLEGQLDPSVVSLVNERNGHLVTFTPMVEGSTWGDLKQSFIDSAAEKGRGSEIERFKDEVEHWVLPHEQSRVELVVDEEDACVLPSSEYKAFEWDIIEELM